MRVSELANELGAESKDIRKFLRSRYGNVGTGGRWYLDPEKIEQVRWRFEGEGRKEPRASRATGGMYIPSFVRRHSGPAIKDKVRELQAEPQDIHIKVVGSTEDLVFHRIIQCWTGRGRRSPSLVVVLLSNGEFKESKDLSGVSSWLLESQYCLVRGENCYHAHHVNYVQLLTETPIPQWLITNLIARPQATGRDDTPQELLINDYSRLLSSKLAPSSILRWEHDTGRLAGELTLRELWGPTFKIISDLDPNIRMTLSRYFATVNLFQEQPPLGEAFGITIGELFRRFHIEVGQRAKGLRRDVAQAWGFEECSEGWRKRKDQDEVLISSNLRVHINRKFVCIVSAKSSQLPHDDEVARRMLAVATAHRDQIYTIKGEVKEALERLFPIGSGNHIDR